ncbi:MAG: Flavobacterium phage 11b [Bacteroidota bacterium]|jgi:hypothetical protein
MTNTELKAQIDSQITNETSANAITPTDVGTNLKAVVDFINYNSYTALISQSGTDSPIAKVLNNTTGVTFSFSRNSAGNYMITGSSNVFTTDQTAIIHSINTNGSFSNSRMYVYSIGAQFFTIETYNATTATDGIITDAFIEIRIYN